MVGKINRPARTIAKNELKKERVERKTLTFLLFLTAISVSCLFLFLISQASIQGYATYVESSAGSITELTIYRKFDTTYWNGVYGLALRVSNFTEQLSGEFGPGQIIRQDLFFNCIQSGVAGGNEIYASLSPTINFDNLSPATPAQIDAFTGCSDKVDCAVNTFTQNMYITLGSENITNIPATYTYKWDGQNNLFDLGILTDGTNLVYVTHISSIQPSYNKEKIVNFQMLLPVNSNSTKYYFFTDPNDVCPASSGIGENLLVNLEGYVFDEAGNPLNETEIIIAGVSVNSSSDGHYALNFSVISGTYNLFAKKTGYDDYFSNITANFTLYNLTKNITMKIATPGIDNVMPVKVYGQVVDKGGNSLADARILLGNSNIFSDINGTYNISAFLTPGEHSLVSTKEGYNNFHISLNFTTSGQIINQDIILQDATQQYPFETGPYTEESSEAQKVIEEVKLRGEDHWISAKEINKEVRQNTFIEEEVGVYNLGVNNMNLNFQLSPNIKDFIKIDKTVASLTPDTSTNLKVTIYGTKPLGTYEGALIVSGDIEQTIPIKIKIVDKKYSVEVLLMNIELLKNVVQPGNDLNYKLNLQNLLRDQNYETKINVKLKNVNGSDIYYEDTYDLEIEHAISVLKNIPIPSNLSSGDYILEISAEYLNTVSVATASFVISKPIYLYSFFGIPLWMMFSIISFLSFVSLNVFMYKRHLDKKKRYRIAVDYDTLPKAGPRVVKLGRIAETTHPVYYEIDKLTTHAIVAGATGMGKSISAQVLIEEALLQGICVLVFDPTAQWSGVLRKCDDKKMLSFYSKFGLKPQDAKAFKGNVRMIKDSKQVLDINKFMAPGQIQIFSMNKLTPAEIDVFVANVIKQIFRSDPKESPQLKMLLVFDEVHRLLPKFGGSGAGFLQIERACREFRKWGLGVMLISQVLNDFVGEIKANINTELQTRTLEEGDLERIRSKYGEEFLKSLVRAEVGVIMFQNAEYNRGRPYFVNFRPILHSTRRLSDEELEKYNKYNDLVDDLEFQIEKLESEKVDTFDLKMELKLIKDKIMSGSFSVVEIYLEGLKPRVQKEWEKLGKKAPERKLELVDELILKEEEKKTKEENKKLVEETKKAEEKNK